MLHFLRLLKEKLPFGRNGKAASYDDPNVLPFLPEVRPRLLTPASSFEDLSLPVATKKKPPTMRTAMDNYGEFRRLPVEVRRVILQYAFGMQTLHVDLYYDHPLAAAVVPTASEEDEAVSDEDGTADTSDTSDTSDTTAGGTLLPVMEAPHALGRQGRAKRGDKQRPEGWQWFSCVCQRPAGLVQVNRPSNHKRLPYELSPSDDRCLEDALNGTGPWAPTKGGQFGGKELSIGIMGWLLSCRVAYVRPFCFAISPFLPANTGSRYAEGLEILFSTNTFHVSRMDLLLNMTRFVLPHRLRRITSLELLWNFATPATESGPPDWYGSMTEVWQPLLLHGLIGRGPITLVPNGAPMYELCRMIPETFPKIQNLYVSFQSNIYPDMACPNIVVQSVVLNPIEDMMRLLRLRPGLGPGSQLRFGVQYSLFYYIASGFRDQSYWYNESDWGKKVWKPFGHTSELWPRSMPVLVMVPTTEERPEPDTEPGYWVSPAWH